MSSPATTPAAPRDDAPSAVARRFGPPIVIGALVVMVAMMAWSGLAPTAVAGPLSEAPYIVPATIVVGPDVEGCVHLVAGDGSEDAHCYDDLAADEDVDYRYAEASFTADGLVVVYDESDQFRRRLTIDPATGEVLEILESEAPMEELEPRESIDGDLPAEEEMAPGDEDVVVDPPMEGPRSGEEMQVYVESDRVLRWHEGPETGDDEVVLDLQGPPGYRLRDAVLSPDGDWVVVTTERDEVVVAPTDGSADPYLWTEITDDRWVDLWRAIRWDG